MQHVRDDILQMSESYPPSIPSPSELEVIASCQGGGEITENDLPESETHKGPLQPHKSSVIEHNDTPPNYQSILAMLKSKRVINFTSPLFLTCFSLCIHSLKNSISMMEECVSFSFFSFFFLHYNYGLEGYQLNVSNYRMLQN